MPHHGYWDNGGNWAGWVLMILVLLVFSGILAWVVVSFLRHRDGHPATPPAAPGADPGAGGAAGPLGILNERFARGDIDEEDYVRRRDLLTGKEPPPPS